MPGLTNTSSIIWGLLFGSIGMGFFIYGKKQNAPVAFFSGLGLMVFPYFVTSTWLMLLTGAVLMALPYFIRL